MSKSAKILAQELELRQAKGVLFGMWRGYPLSIKEAGNIMDVGIGLSFNLAETKGALAARIVENKKQFKAMGASPTGAGISVTFANGMGGHKNVMAFLEWLAPMLGQMGAIASRCPICGMELSDTRTWATVDGAVYCAHGSCLEKKAEESRQENIEASSQKKNAGRGAIGALLGGIVGSIPWLVVSYFGYIASICGLLISMGAKKGYELFGGKPGKAKVAIVILATLVGLAATFALNIIVILVEMMINGEIVGTFGDILAVTWSLLSDPEYWGEIAGDVGLSVLFAALGCAGVIKELSLEAKGPGQRVEFLTTH